MLEFTLRFALFATIHSLLAAGKVKTRLLPLMHGWSKFYRILYNIVAMASFGWAMDNYQLSPIIYAVPGGAGLLFYLIQGLLLLLLIKCTAQTGIYEFLGISQIMNKAEREPILVTSGCYGIVRHPQYALVTLFLLFNPFVSLKWLIFSILAVIYMAIGTILEEQRLTALFGERYREYQAMVPRFIPRFNRA